MLFEIARGTSQNHKIAIMTRTCLSATNRNGVLKMEDISSMATFKSSISTICIIATVLLTFQFLLNMLSSKGSTYMLFLCSPFVDNGRFYQIPTLRLKIPFLPLIYLFSVETTIPTVFFPVFSIILTLTTKKNFSIFPMIAARALSKCLSILSRILALFLSKFFLVQNMILVTSSPVCILMFPIILTLPPKKFFFMSGIALKLIGSLFFLMQAIVLTSFLQTWLPLLCIILMMALFTMPIQTIFPSFIKVEMSRCSREKPFALTALLERGIGGYNIIHSKESFPCCHASGCSLQRGGTLLSQVYHKPA